MKKILTICLMLLGAVAQAQNFAITATTEAAIRKNIVKGNAANYGFAMINDTLKLVGLTTRNVIFTGSTSKTDIGLGNVDNTSDLNKPVSTATQTALNLKANIASPTFTGTLTAPTIANSLGANFATSSGSVGIGTASPQNLLHIKGTASVGIGVRSSHLTIESSETAGVDVGAVLKFAGQSGNAVNPYSFGTIEGRKESAVSNNYSSYMTFQTIDNTGGSTERMRINGSGNIGIGTTNPASKLHIAGTSYVTSTIQTSSTTAGSLLSLISGSRTYSLGSRSDFATGALNIVDETAGALRFSIFSTGRVGIGTTTDAGYLLDVNGTARVTGNSIFSGNVGIGTTSPNASSILDITSTTKGVLFPRMTTTEISAIASPADGLTVYNTTLKAICFYDAGAAVWKKVSHSNM